MHNSYSDILSRIDAEPIWWLNGVPRFSPFTPGDVCIYKVDTALVHTQCQSCGKRYDVAVRGADLREKIAYMASLDVGDPPHACCRVGATMSSEEIRILEYWRPLKSRDRGWVRLNDWERPLVDSDASTERVEPVFRRISNSCHADAWRQARKEGDYPTLVSILKAVGCELAESVAHMVDAERLRDDVARTISDFWKARNIGNSSE